MALNTCEATWRHEDESEETESQDYIMSTDTCVWGVCKSAISLTPLTEQSEANNDDEMLLNAEFAAKEKELEYYAGLAQK